MGTRDRFDDRRPVVGGLVDRFRQMTQRSGTKKAVHRNVHQTVWSGRLLLPASSLVTTLAIITLPLYRLWNASGFVLLLSLIVAGWIATVLDGVVAYLSLRNPSLTLQAPLTTVDEPTRVQVTEASPDGALVDLADPAIANVGVRVGEGASFVVRFGQRGVYATFGGEMTIVGPLGIIACRRRFSAEVDGGIVVGPSPDDAPPLPDPAAISEPSDLGAVGRGADLTRTVRPYRRGDTQSAVAWKSSARAGELMVREVEGVVDQEIVIAVQVSDTLFDPRSEEAVRRAAGYVIDALRSGKVVRLVATQEDPVVGSGRVPPRFGTFEAAYSAGPSRIHSAVVRNETELIHRLALVVPGADLRRRPDREDESQTPVFLVSPTGDHWVGQSV